MTLRPYDERSPHMPYAVTPLLSVIKLEFRRNGRGDRIRTCDPLVPNQMRYQAALLPDMGSLV